MTTNELTDTAWATRWLTATGAANDMLVHGYPVRSYGKDQHGYLVAVRNEAGTFPVRNLPAVLAHRCGCWNFTHLGHCMHTV